MKSLVTILAVILAIAVAFTAPALQVQAQLSRTRRIARRRARCGTMPARSAWRSNKKFRFHSDNKGVGFGRALLNTDMSPTELDWPNSG